MRFKLFMMKNIFIILFYFIMVNSFSQTGEVIYNIESIKQDKLDNPMVIGITSEYELMKFTLKYDKSNSSFTLNRNVPKNKKWFNYAKILSENYDNTWYQNFLTKESIVNKTIGSKQYQVVYDRMSNWELTEETKIIQGYTCYKATRKEINKIKRLSITYTAWFAPEIPASYGPIGNGGLPGMILQLKKPNVVVFTVKKITLNKKGIKIQTPKNGEKINIEQRNKLMRKARKVTID